MKSILSKIFQFVLRAIPLGVFPYLVRREVLGLFYHMVSDEPAAHMKHLYPPVPVAAFEAALVYLKKRYRMLSYEDYLSLQAAGDQMPPRAMLLSFDDGYRECFTVVRPLLLKHQIPCTFFVTTDFVDNGALFYRNKVSLCIERAKAMGEGERGEIFGRLNVKLGLTLTGLEGFAAWIKGLRYADDDLIEKACAILGVDVARFLADERPYMTSEEINQMQAEGFTIGAHSQTHRKLGLLPEEEIISEIAGSCDIVARLIGKEQVPFSFPHSAEGIERDLLAEVRAGNPSVGLLFDTRGLRTDVDFMVNRIWAETPAYDDFILPNLLRGFYRDHLWGRLRRGVVVDVKEM